MARRPRTGWFRGGRAPRVVLVLLLVEIAVFLVSTLPGVRTTSGFDPLLDGWLQGVGYVTAAVLAVLRPLTSPVDRGLWSLLSLALVCRALGFVLFLAVVRIQDPRPYPSVADAAWLAMYAVMLVGLVQLGRLRARRLSVTLFLDGAIGALAAAAVAVTLLYPAVRSITAGGAPPAAVVVNLAYPVLDLMLLVVLIGVLLAYQWRPPPAAWVLAAGVAGFAVIDGVFVYQSAAGTFRPGTLLSPLALAVMALVAVAGWLPGVERRAGRLDPLPDVMIPGLFALVCLGVLVVATQRHAPLPGVVLAGLGVTLAITRTGLSFRAVRSLAEHRREARTDELTGLANRRSFNESLERALAHRPPERRFALLVADLDDFKAVNDSLGHHYGDELLRLAAPRLQQAVRAGDVVARIGGDEFGVLLADADDALAVRIAERLRAGFRRPFRLGARDVVIAPSVGIALVPEDGREPVELLQHADLAMYEAKSTRSGQAVFRRRLHDAGRRLETTARLRQAIERGEMVLHYQPLVSLDTGTVAGVEALVRWRHPDAGLLQPGTFLHQVESGGLMPVLTGAVLEQAIRQGAAWSAAGRRLTVAVNLSVTNLLDPAFPDQVVGLLADAGLPAGTLELELTEDLFMADPARARRAIMRLLDAGVSLVIDDYGTGFSSLGYLRDLRDVRGLKLDRSFVTRLDADARAQAIVESTIKLAHALGMHVVGEGVETESVRRRLAAFGCELAQGHLFSAPLPAAELDLGVLDAARRAP